MGYQDAIKDGIRIGKGLYNDTIYFPLCHICGKEIKSLNYQSIQKYTCHECKLKNYMADKEIKIESDRLAKEKKFEKAVQRIQSKVANIKPYEYAIDKIHRKLHVPGWFQSTEEIMVAIELVRRHIKARHQVKFGRYRADFVLPDDKIVLEVDGTLYHTEKTKAKEIVRDDLIVLALGPDWDVIRVTDTLINQNITRLAKAIKGTKQKRNKLREQNGGIIPEWYSDRKL